jgi:hypothetical protein
MRTTQHLTSPDPEFDRRVAATHPGQAHFAGTGPNGATCGQCIHLGYLKRTYTAAGEPTSAGKSNGCVEFLRLIGKHGPAVPRHALACRYFKPVP